MRKFITLPYDEYIRLKKGKIESIPTSTKTLPPQPPPLPTSQSGSRDETPIPDPDPDPVPAPESSSIDGQLGEPPPSPESSGSGPSEKRQPSGQSLPPPGKPKNTKPVLQLSDHVKKVMNGSTENEASLKSTPARKEESSCISQKKTQPKTKNKKGSHVEDKTTTINQRPKRANRTSWRDTWKRKWQPY